MNKKIIIVLVFILILAGGGFFWWWQDRESVRELNRDLPEGVRVIKNLAGEYWVINEIDGYEIKVPEEWGGLERINYFSDQTENKEYNITGINILGLKGESRLISIDQYKIKEGMVDLENFAKELLKKSEILTNLIQDRVGNKEVFRLNEPLPLIGQMYFIENENSIFLIGGISDKFIRGIIANGKW